MDTVVNQLAREMSEAISAALAADPKVEAIREKARAAVFEMRLSLEASIGFAPATKTPGKPGGKTTSSKKPVGRAPLDMTANDRRFLKSLRISSDETTSQEADK